MFFSEKFIARTKEYTTLEKSVPAPCFRKSFMLKNIPRSAEITVCGLGFYELYLNGMRITKGRLAPYIGNVDDFLYYDNYEVAQFLREGENVIGVLLGNGLLNNAGGYIWEFDRASFRSAPKLALAFETDGKLLFEADEGFKTAPSPILFDDYRIGEYYDATKEQEGWRDVGFDDRLWEAPLAAECPKGEAHLVDTDPISISDEYMPVSVIKSEAGYIYQFPYNISGVCRLHINARAGQKITLLYGEYVKRGKLEIDNICCDSSCGEYFHRDEYICKDGEQEYTPTFTFHGFQYVYVEGIEEKQATKDLLTALFLHSDVKSVGEFVCSNEQINRLQENTRRSDLSNLCYFPMDCPQREKNGWTGDAALSAEQMSLNFNVSRSMREWLKNARAAQTEEGEFPGIIPTTSWGFEWGNGPAWDTFIVQLPYYCYKYEGDKSILEENFQAICKYFRYAVGKADRNGLYAYGLGDWSQPAHAVGQYDTDLRITDTLTLMDYCMKAERIANVLNERDWAAEFSAAFKRMKASFRNAFIEEGKIKEKFATQTAVAMAIAYGGFEENEFDCAKGQLLSLIHVKNDHFDTGILGARVLFRVLSDLGESDLALKLILNPTFPSYAYHLNRGATTLWECFYELKEDELETKNGWSLNSLNHHFWGDISAWFYRYLGGIRLNPNLQDKTVVIDPVFLKEIDWVKAKHICPDGEIKVEWKRENGKIDLRVDAPHGYRVIKKECF